MLATTFWEKPFADPFGNWLCPSCWCLGGLSIFVSVVVGVLVTLWWCVCSVLTFFSDVLSVLSMSWWCSGWCLRGIEGMVFV